MSLFCRWGFPKLIGVYVKYLDNLLLSVYENPGRESSTQISGKRSAKFGNKPPSTCAMLLFLGISGFVGLIKVRTPSRMFHKSSTLNNLKANLVCRDNHWVEWNCCRALLSHESELCPTCIVWGSNVREVGVRTRGKPVMPCKKAVSDCETRRIYLEFHLWWDYAIFIEVCAFPSGVVCRYKVLVQESF